MAYKTQTNLLAERETYNRYYGGFRGVDFSSDHTQVIPQRLAYAVNMYRDYGSGQGQALETVPGFRRRFVAPGGERIYGIHSYLLRDKDGVETRKTLVHAGTHLYLWDDLSKSVNVEKTVSVSLPLGVELPDTNGIYSYQLLPKGAVASVRSVERVSDGEELFVEGAVESSVVIEDGALMLRRSGLEVGEAVRVCYCEAACTENDHLRLTIENDGKALLEMNEHKSTSFVFLNKIYLIDGKNYLVYDGEKLMRVTHNAFVPTTYQSIEPAGRPADEETKDNEFRQRNLLSPYFRHTYVGDGVSKDYYLMERDATLVSVEVYGHTLTVDTNYEYDSENGVIKFYEAPKAPGDAEYPRGYAGIVVTAEKWVREKDPLTDAYYDLKENILGCTIATVFDGRVFLSGNPKCPNQIFWCGRDDGGLPDPSYFGVADFVLAGLGESAVRAMVPVANTLMVLKGDTQQDGSVSYLSPHETGEDAIPVIYTSVQGLHGIGCLGAAANFLDDPVFVSRLGLEGVSMLSSGMERTIQHRSSLIDAKLTNLDLTKARLAEWGGYLVLLVDGKIFLADSRQPYTHDSGVTQYEWYYLEDIGVWDGQYFEFRYATEFPKVLSRAKVRYTPREGEATVELPLRLSEDDKGEIVNPPLEDGKESATVYEGVAFVEQDDGETVELGAVPFFVCEHKRSDKTTETVACLCEEYGNMTGGVFHPACELQTVDDVLYFGTENGVICSFNTDMRDESGEISPVYYTFDGRTIFSGCATKMDCCDIPHLTKSTVKKSTVIKTKSMQSSAAKLKVRTNKKPYAQIARINSTAFSFGNIDFSEFTFVMSEQSLFAVKEKEKKWVEKQYFLYSDEFMKPFGVYYVSFRYSVVGRYKQ